MERYTEGFGRHKLFAFGMIPRKLKYTTRFVISSVYFSLFIESNRLEDLPSNGSHREGLQLLNVYHSLILCGVKPKKVSIRSLNLL